MQAADSVVLETEYNSLIRGHLERTRNTLKQWFGVTQEDLAGLVGIAPATLSNIGKAGRTPRASSTRTLLRVYAIADQMRRAVGDVQGERWLRSIGLQILRDNGVDALERVSDKQLFTTLDRRLADPTVADWSGAELFEATSTDLNFEVERL